MLPRERVKIALKRERVPDKVPLEFDLCKSLLEKFSKKLNIPLNYTRSYYEDLTYRISGNEIRTALGSDCVIVGAGLPEEYSPIYDENGYLVNEFGMKMKQGPLYMEVIEPPLKNISSKKEAENYIFPDPLAPGRFEDADKYIKKYKENYFIIGDLELTMFEMAWHLVGMEKFMMDLASGEAYTKVLIDKAMNFSLEIGKKLIQLGVDAIWTGDDFGAQNGMLISPMMWKNIFKPRYREVFSEFKNINKDVFIIYHSDGAISPILEDLVEIGMDVFNPMQPNVPGHEPHDLKQKYGDRLSFFGGIDQQWLLPKGSKKEIEKDVKDKISIFGKDGGYMIAPAHIIQADTSAENVETFLNAVKKYGRY